jgi:GNAT superfamily N-acetyltransferase
MTEIVLRHAENGAEIGACFPVMVRLRPHLANAEEFAARVARQHEAGYRLLVAWRAGAPIGLAGYRVEETLIHGRFIYVDDLVTSESERRHGIGARLLEAVAAEGRRLGCGRLVLDTALDNVLAHRFYYRQGLVARALRFSRDLDHDRVVSNASPSDPSIIV